MDWPELTMYNAGMLEFMQRGFLRTLNLFLPKIIIPSSGSKGVVLYASHGRINFVILAVKSLYYFMGFALPTAVFDDGRLTSRDVKRLKKYLPGVKVFLKKDTDLLIKKFISGYKYCNKYRYEELTYRYNIKLFDPFLLPGFSKTIYIDNDIIFFSRPKEIIKWLDSDRKYTLYATESKQNGSESFEWLTIERMFTMASKTKLPERFNSGFVCINKSNYDLKKVNRSLSYTYLFNLQKSWTPEQYALGVLCGDGNGIDVGRKYIHLTRQTKVFVGDPFKKVFLHFAFQARPYYYKYALLLALKTQFFRKKFN